MSIEAMKQALEALEEISGSQDDSNIGYRGREGTTELYACEYCQQKDYDFSKIPHLHKCPVPKAYTAINALRAAIEQAEQAQPVAWALLKNGVPVNVFLTRVNADDPYWQDKGYSTAPLYTTPPQRKPLTDEETKDLYVRVCGAIEAAHGIKE